MFWSKNNKTQLGLELNFYFEETPVLNDNESKKIYKERVLHNKEIARVLSIETGMIETLDISDVANVLIKKYKRIQKKIMDLKIDSVGFCIIVVIENNEKPIINIEGELKQLIFSLNADIIIDYFKV